jgi:Bacteriophage baseplate protein W
MNDIVGRRVVFPFRLGDRNQIGMVTDDMAIHQSIFVIINTVPGERVMRPDFGCEIHSLIFSPANYQTAALAERYVKEALLRWEPRIDVQAVDITFGETEHAELFINVLYTLKREHDPRSLVYRYSLLP